MPGDKDLEKIIAGIGVEEQAAAQKQAQIDRMKRGLVEKQKKEISEQGKLIDELQGKIKNMYDLPADVEELKRLIGEQRADINNKDQQLEMSYGQVAQLDAELKNTRSQINLVSKNLDTYLSQVGELKAKLMEKDGIVRLREKELQEAQMKIDALQDNMKKIDKQFSAKVGDMSKGVSDSYSQISALKADIAQRDAKIAYLEKELKNTATSLEQSKQYQENVQNQLSTLQDQLREQSLGAQDLRSKIESELKEQMYSAKGEFSKKISDLEARNLELELSSKQNKQTAETATRTAEEIKAKMTDLMNKSESTFNDRNKLDSELKEIKVLFKELKEFKDRNSTVVQNMQGLMKLFEDEPKFKCFNIVNKVGEVSIEDMKGALGVPSVTTNKYVQLFVGAGVFEISPNGKIALKNKMQSFQ